MTYPDMLGQTAELLDTTLVGMDGYNVPIAELATVATVRCRLQEVLIASTEDVAGRDTVASEWKLFLEADAVLSPFGQAVVDGRTFEVLGPPYPVHTPAGLHHYEVRLREVLE